MAVIYESSEFSIGSRIAWEDASHFFLSFGVGGDPCHFSNHLPAGVMNLLWVAAIMVFVLVERVVPCGEVVGKVTGVALIVAAVIVGGGLVPGS